MKRAVLLFVTLFISNVTYAVCENAKTLFFCQTQKGKQIAVCDAGTTIDYAFGKSLAHPEILVKAARDSATTYQWNGMGSSISYAIDIPNQHTTYSVFWSADRNNDAHAIEAGVHVFVNKELKTTVHCTHNDLINNMEGVDLKPSE